MIGFAGPRVVKETTHQDLPDGFQTAEFMHEHGLVDMIVERRDMRHSIAKTVGLPAEELGAMLFVVLAAWLVGVGVSLVYGNRALPGAIFGVGATLSYVQFSGVNLGYTYIIGMALLAIVIWIANRVEMGV